MQQQRDHVTTTLPCPACGAYQTPRKSWLWRCAGCGFMSSNLQPGLGTGLEGLEDLRRANCEVILDRLEQHGALSGLGVLDVGCAKGWFLTAARARGADVYGIEPQQPHAIDAQASGLNVEIGFFPQDLQARGPYDIIAFNDVFEHLPAPEQAIAAVERLLKPGGLAVISLPSSRGVLYRIAALMDAAGMPGPFERLWQKGLPSPHMSYFTPGTLQLLVERHTPLRIVDGFALPSFRRARLWQRIAVTHRGPMAWAMLAGLWSLSFVLPALPADIHVAIFRKPG